MNSITILLYAIACLAVTVTPGPTMLIALSNGASRNRTAITMGIAGAALSDVILIGAVAAGLGAVLSASEALFNVVRWVGVIYLVWIAIQMWRAPAQGLPDSSASNRGDSYAIGRRAFLRSLLVALSNPKGLLFFSAFLPQFIDTSQPQAMQYLILALLTAVLDAAIMACYALGGTQVARVMSAQGLQILYRVCASILASLAAILALYRRTNP